MDSSERWTINSGRGTNLLQTLTHEIGHSLGLSHSDVRDSVTAPFYRGFTPSFSLASEDGSYGQLFHSNKIDAIFRTADNSSYVFLGSQYWKRRSSAGTDLMTSENNGV